MPSTQQISPSRGSTARGGQKTFQIGGVGKQASWSWDSPLGSRNLGSLWGKTWSIPVQSPALEARGWVRMGGLRGGLFQARQRWDSPGGGGVGTSVAGGVGGTLLLRGRTGVGVSGVAGAGTVVAKGVVGAGPVVAGRVVGAGLAVARVVVRVRPTAG